MKTALKKVIGPDYFYIVALLLIAVLFAVALPLHGCATSPEAKLKQGYNIVTATAKSTTVLLDRHAISSADAQSVLDLAKPAQAALDRGTAELTACRARQVTDPKVDCEAAIQTVDLAIAVSTQLENFLKAKAGGK